MVIRDTFMGVLKKIWRVKNGVEIEVVAGNVFAFHFKTHEERRRIWVGDPWTFDDDLIMLEVPIGKREIGKLPFNRVEFWVQIHCVPLLCMSKKVGRFLGSMVGEVIKVDEGVSGDDGVKFLRVRIVVEIDKPLCCCLRVDVLGDGEETVNHRSNSTRGQRDGTVMRRNKASTTQPLKGLVLSDGMMVVTVTKEIIAILWALIIQKNETAIEKGETKALGLGDRVISNTRPSSMGKEKLAVGPHEDMGLLDKKGPGKRRVVRNDEQSGKDAGDEKVLGKRGVAGEECNTVEEGSKDGGERVKFLEEGAIQSAQI
ncbi:hypothetical protein EZV62_024637 [Acer yangbiense]|uniref:Uncharacterized protein n=1 Tax=Acer yangbiense TaxID=1000413 RepID=A0A5C7GWQ9_9ROSI|nr:hypothetical protein EZV62_024637 [Acer yangbiense]